MIPGGAASLEQNLEYIMGCKLRYRHDWHSLTVISRERLTQALPAPGGVRRVNSEEEGWELWTTYLAAGEVRVIPRR